MFFRGHRTHLFMAKGARLVDGLVGGEVLPGSLLGGVAVGAAVKADLNWIGVLGVPISISVRIYTVWVCSGILFLSICPTITIRIQRRAGWRWCGSYSWGKRRGHSWGGCYWRRGRLFLLAASNGTHDERQ